MTNSLLPIALDAMGGDHAPTEPIAGAVAVAREDGLAVCLVGDGDVIRAELKKLGSIPGSITIVHASETIEMHEHPAKALRAKPNASLPLTVTMVKDGRARAAVSAGNSGAIMAAGIFVLKRLEGIDRPAFGGAIPTKTGLTFLVDMGANADCKPGYLLQFAQMGAVYARLANGIANPRVGLISNGEEEGKGSALTLAAYDLLKDSGLNFVGNIEGNDVTGGSVDVGVCDGFTGNVILKSLEGAASTIISMLRESLRSSPRARIGAILAMPALRALGKRIDYAEFGGVPVLGVNGVLVNCHGRSKGRAVAQGLRLAHRLADQDMPAIIARELSAHPPPAT
jgi:glycerol-3-phosphate acyltransferase PlsX